MYYPCGLQEASAIFTKSDKFLVYYDPDPDGLISGHFVVNLLKMYGKPYQYYINENRKHGMYLTDEQLQTLKGYTIVAVDFSIPTEVLQKIIKMGINVVNIDHHDIGSTKLDKGMADNGCEYVVINNQYIFEPDEWKFLSGAGMVYYVLAALFPEWGKIEQNKALIGISLLSDIRAIENNHAYELLKLTYHWQDDFSKYLIDIAKYGASSFNFGVQRYLDRNFIDYSLCPRLNALFRLNLGDVAVKIFEREPVDLTKLNACLGLASDNTILNLTYVVKQAKAIQAEINENLSVIPHEGLVIGYVNEDELQLNRKYNISNFVGLGVSKTFSGIRDSNSYFA